MMVGIDYTRCFWHPSYVLPRQPISVSSRQQVRHALRQVIWKSTFAHEFYPHTPRRIRRLMCRRYAVQVYRARYKGDPRRLSA